MGRKWGWYQSLHTLAKEDPARINEATKLNVHTALMFLEYEKDKNKVETALIRSAQNKKIMNNQFLDG